MTTYEIPDEPDVDTLWGPTPDGEGWIKYIRITAPGGGPRTWWRPSDRTFGGYWWEELIRRGPLTDVDPDPPLEELADRVVSAARLWHSFAPGEHGSQAANRSLRDAVVAYEKKANSPST